MTEAVVLQARHLSSSRGDRELFTRLSFDLAEGGLLHVQGTNGSGKTTLLRVLCGLIHPDEGEVYWSGCSIHRYRDRFLQDLHYVGHLNGIKAELSPVENLHFASTLTHRTTGRQVEQALEQVHLFGFEHEPARTLSAGQRRRIALARLLMSPARIWILDEPFTALDTTGIGLLEAMIHRHVESGGVVVMASHSIHDIDSRHIQELYLAN